MSLYREHKTALRDAVSLVEALRQTGFKPIVSETPRPLEGFLGDKRKTCAEIIIPRKQVGWSSNDIGFKKEPDGSFAAVISEFDQHKYNDAWLTEIKGLATEIRATRIAKNLKLKPAGRKVLPNGQVRLQFVQEGR